MRLTEVRIHLCGSHHPSHPTGAAPGRGNGHGPRLRAFCSITFDDAFAVRDVKLIEGDDGLFLAMPSRKLCDHCPHCREKNHLRARFCCGCGARLDEDRHARQRNGNGHSHGNGHGRPKLHADIAHPINPAARERIEREVIAAYWREVDRSRQPGYVPQPIDGMDLEYCEDRPAREPAGGASAAHAAPARSAVRMH